MVLLASLGGCQCSPLGGSDARVDLAVDLPRRERPDRSRVPPADRWRPDDNWRSAIELVWDRLVAAKQGGADLLIAFDGTRFALGTGAVCIFDTQATLIKQVPLPKPVQYLWMTAGDGNYGAVFRPSLTDPHWHFAVVQPDGTMDLGTAVKLTTVRGVATWSSKLGNYHSQLNQDPPQLGQWRFTAAGKPVGSGPVTVEPGIAEGAEVLQAGWLGNELVLLSKGGKLPKGPGDATYAAYVRFLSPPYTTTRKYDALPPKSTLGGSPPVMAAGAGQVFVGWSRDADGKRGTRVSLVDFKGNVTPNPPLITEDDWHGGPVAATFYKNHFVLVGGGFPIYATVYDTSLKQVIPPVNLPRSRTRCRGWCWRSGSLSRGAGSRGVGVRMVRGNLLLSVAPSQLRAVGKVLAKLVPREELTGNPPARTGRRPARTGRRPARTGRRPARGQRCPTLRSATGCGGEDAHSAPDHAPSERMRASGTASTLSASG